MGEGYEPPEWFRPPMVQEWPSEIELAEVGAYTPHAQRMAQHFWDIARDAVVRGEVPVYDWGLEDRSLFPLWKHICEYAASAVGGQAALCGGGVPRGAGRAESASAGIQAKQEAKREAKGGAKAKAEGEPTGNAKREAKAEANGKAKGGSTGEAKGEVEWGRKGEVQGGAKGEQKGGAKREAKRESKCELNRVPLESVVIDVDAVVIELDP